MKQEAACYCYCGNVGCHRAHGHLQHVALTRKSPCKYCKQSKAICHHAMKACHYLTALKSDLTVHVHCFTALCTSVYISLESMS